MKSILKKTYFLSFLSYKLKGGALMFSLFIMIILSVFLGMLFITSHFEHLVFSRTLIHDHAWTDVYSTFDYLLEHETGFKKTGEIDLFNDGQHETQYKIDNYGVYELLTVKTQTKGTKISKSALLGRSKDKMKQPLAIYLTDRNTYLSLSGKTIISGTCFLPKKGVKKIYIQGKGFSGHDLEGGTIRQSKTSLPQPEKSFISGLSSLFSPVSISDSFTIHVADFNHKAFTNSFAKEKKILYSQQSIELTGCRIFGNIQVFSTEEIYISKNASLSGCLITAPFIHISDGFTGDIQVFATDSITTGKNCMIQYPGYLAVLPQDNNKNKKIILGENSTIIGGIALLRYGRNKHIDYYYIKTEKDSKVYGRLYSSGAIELYGHVYGQVYCSQFITKTNTTTYENCLFNVTIDSYALTDEFVFSKLLQEQGTKEIIKWLN